MKKYCYFNGKIADSNKVGIPLNDIGIIRGIAIFDYLRTYNGSPFKLNDYYNRFKVSAQKIGLNFSLSENELAQILQTLLKKNQMHDGAFRLVLTGGKSSDCFLIEGNENFYILVEDLPGTDPKYYKLGGKLITNEYQRQFSNIKSNFYLQASKLQKEKERAKANEILYFSNGLILECSKSNIFIVKKGKVITPKKNILYGITRKAALEIAKKSKIKIEERDVKLSELWNADEVFITSSGSAKILPITKIDTNVIADGQVGPISKLMMLKFLEMTNQ